MKRIFDLLCALLALLLLAPLLCILMLAVYAQDLKSPLYIAPRVGAGGRAFKMIKLRSMIINADKNGVASTSNDDRRITRVGHLIRKSKADELLQLVNVVMGDMSLVGPRPNVLAETSLYTNEEKRLLSVRPGITDFASIVFSDEGDILEGADDPDLRYNQLIRPGKGFLGLLYIDNQSFTLDLKLICLTVVAVASKPLALRWLTRMLRGINAPAFLVDIAARDTELVPMPPPGSNRIVEER